jgi:hypothetical protein
MGDFESLNHVILIAIKKDVLALNIISIFVNEITIIDNQN